MAQLQFQPRLRAPVRAELLPWAGMAGLVGKGNLWPRKHGGDYAACLPHRRPSLPYLCSGSNPSSPDQALLLSALDQNCKKQGSGTRVKGEGVRKHAQAWGTGPDTGGNRPHGRGMPESQ